MLRLGEELRGRRDLDHTAGIHDADPVGDLRQQAEIVGDIEHRHAKPRAQIDQQRDDLLLRRHVEAGRRLVEHDEGRVAGERHGDADALLLAARELVRIAALELHRRRQADEAEQFARPFAVAAVIAVPCARRISSICSPTLMPGIERRRRVLRHEGDARAAQPIESGRSRVRRFSPSKRISPPSVRIAGGR